MARGIIIQSNAGAPLDFHDAGTVDATKVHQPSDLDINCGAWSTDLSVELTGRCWAVLLERTGRINSYTQVEYAQDHVQRSVMSANGKRFVFSKSQFRSTECLMRLVYVEA